VAFRLGLGYIHLEFHGLDAYKAYQVGLAGLNKALGFSKKKYYLDLLDCILDVGLLKKPKKTKKMTRRGSKQKKFFLATDPSLFSYMI
jgi:hypothetical protein